MEKITVNSIKGGRPQDGWFVSGPLPQEFHSISLQAYDCDLEKIMVPWSGVNAPYYTSAMVETAARVLMYSTMMNKLGIDTSVSERVMVAVSYQRLAADIEKSNALERSFLEEALNLPKPASLFSLSAAKVQKPLSEILRVCLEHLTDDGFLDVDEQNAAYLPSWKLIEELAKIH